MAAAVAVAGPVTQRRVEGKVKQSLVVGWVRASAVREEGGERGGGVRENFLLLFVGPACSEFIKMKSLGTTL